MGADNIKSFRSLIDNKSVSVVDWANKDPKAKEKQADVSESMFAMSMKDKVAKYEPSKKQPVVSNLFRNKA